MLGKNEKNSINLREYWESLKADLEKFYNCNAQLLKQDNDEADEESFKKQKEALEIMLKKGLQIEDTYWVPTKKQLGKEIDDTPEQIFGADKIPVIAGPKSYAIAKKVYILFLERFKSVHFSDFIIVAAKTIGIDIKERQQENRRQAAALKAKIEEYEKKNNIIISDVAEPESTIAYLVDKLAGLKLKFESLETFEKLLKQGRYDDFKNLKKIIDSENKYRTCKEAIEACPFTQETKALLEEHETKNSGIRYLVTLGRQYDPVRVIKQAFAEHETAHLKEIEKQIAATKSALDAKLTERNTYLKALKGFLSTITNPDKQKELQKIKDTLNNRDECEKLEISQLESMVQDVKKTAAEHKDTGIYGALKLTWLRSTSSLKRFYQFFHKGDKPKSDQASVKTATPSQNFLQRFLQMGLHPGR